MDKRIFFSDNGVFEDLTTALGEYNTGTKALSIVAADDAIYIGAKLPFNHLYFKLGATENEEASNIIIQYWDSTTWRSAIETIDETKVAGATLAQSGFISWVPNKTYGWYRSDTNYGGSTVDDLEDLNVYDLYWLKITFSADLTADVVLSWLGQKFSNDDDLGSEFSDLVRSSMLTAYETGKTSWEEQHVRAAEIIISELKSKNIILEKEQILDRKDFTLASVSKTAEIIYGGMGSDYTDDKKLARDEYKTRLSDACATSIIDKNRNARVDYSDEPVMGSLYR